MSAASGEWEAIISDRAGLARRLRALMAADPRQLDELEAFAQHRGVVFTEAEWNGVLESQGRASVPLAWVSMWSAFWDVSGTYFTAVSDGEVERVTLATVDLRVAARRAGATGVGAGFCGQSANPVSAPRWWNAPSAPKVLGLAIGVVLGVMSLVSAVVVTIAAIPGLR